MASLYCLEVVFIIHRKQIIILFFKTLYLFFSIYLKCSGKIQHESNFISAEDVSKCLCILNCRIHVYIHHLQCEEKTECLQKNMELWNGWAAHHVDLNWMVIVSYIFNNILVWVSGFCILFLCKLLIYFRSLGQQKVCRKQNYFFSIWC